MKRNFLFIVFLCFIPVFGFLFSQETGRGVRAKPKDINPDLRSQFALIIGINKYKNKNIDNLNNAVFDAEEVKKILIERYGYQSSNIIDLYDGDANKQNIDSKLRLFADNKIETDSLLIYFSGHGHLDTSYDIGYWLPCDVGEDLGAAAKSMSKEDLINSSGNKIENSVIQGMMKNCRARHILIIADSCYAGKLIDQGSNRSAVGNLPDSYKKKARQVLTSGRELVSDGKPGHHSPFAEHFIQYLESNTQDYVIGAKIIGDLLDIIPRNVPGEEPVGGHVRQVGDRNGQFFLFYQYAEMVEKLYKRYADLWVILNNTEIKRKSKIGLCEKFLEDYKNIPGNEEIDNKRNRIKEEIRRLQKEIKVIDEIKEEYRSLKDLFAREKNTEFKIEKCKNFLNKYKGTPDNEIVKKIFAEINRTLGALNIEERIASRKEESKKVLIKEDKNLTSENNWAQIKKNTKGYYEKTFANGHVMIYIPEKNFWVDKYEVSYAQLEKNKVFRKKRKKSSRKLIRTLTDKHPALVSFEEAETYCRLNKMRLLTNEEWEIIAGRNKGYKYSWGNEEVDAGGIYRANYDDSMDFNDGFKGPAPVRSFEEYSSPYGIVNLSGNVWEWIQGNKCKGGSFFSGEDELKIGYSSTNQRLVGFRCVKEEVEK